MAHVVCDNKGSDVVNSQPKFSRLPFIRILLQNLSYQFLVISCTTVPGPVGLLYSIMTSACMQGNYDFGLSPLSSVVGQAADCYNSIKTSIQQQLFMQTLLLDSTPRKACCG